MPKKGIVACAHDTPREIHDKLWKIYRKYTKPHEVPEGPLKGRKVTRVHVIEGPYKYPKAARPLLKRKHKRKGEGPRHGAWVIIDLSSETSVYYANELARKLRAVPSATATFETLEEATPPY